MRLTRFLVALFSLSLPIHALHADTDKGAVTGVVTFKVKMHSADPLFAETLATGPGNALANVVVYVSAGEAESSGGETNTVTFDQKGCYYSTHVLAVQTGQEIKISNSNQQSRLSQHSSHGKSESRMESNPDTRNARFLLRIRKGRIHSREISTLGCRAISWS
jgi:hypothetical protein